jgi:DNA repair protein RecO (recombination protein O)
MLCKTRSIVLRSIRYSDSSLVVHIYTEQLGRQAFMVKGARRPRSKLPAALFQPLTLLDLEMFHKPRGGLQSIREARRNTDQSRTHEDMARNTIALFLAEVLGKCLREEEHAPGLFAFVHESICELNNRKKGLASFHHEFLMGLTRFLGFSPERAHNPAKPFFDLAEGTFTSLYSGIACLNRADSHLWAALSEGRAEKLQACNRGTRMRLLGFLLTYYRLHMEGFGEINSLEVLRAVFD